MGKEPESDSKFIGLQVGRDFGGCSLVGRDVLVFHKSGVYRKPVSVLSSVLRAHV